MSQIINFIFYQNPTGYNIFEKQGCPEGSGQMSFKARFRGQW